VDARLRQKRQLLQNLKHQIRNARIRGAKGYVVAPFSRVPASFLPWTCAVS